MNILFAGGEDIDFPNGGAPVAVTTSGYFRSGYGRCAIYGTSDLRSTLLPGGSVTSCWLSARVYPTYGGNNATTRFVGLIKDGTTGAGLWVGVLTGSTTKLTLFKYDGSTLTTLASESGTGIPHDTFHRIDMQLVSYGASATVNVYLDGASVISYSGDVTVSGVTSVSAVGIGAGAGLYITPHCSEIVVADSDTRALQGLQTLALTGAGTTTNWTNNTYTNINGTTISDSNPTSVNTTGTDQQYNVTDPTPSVYTVVACIISARMAHSSGSTPDHVNLGWNSGGSVAFGTGASKAVTTAYATYEQIDHTNPVTSAAFAQSEMNALQIDLQSA